MSRSGNIYLLGFMGVGKSTIGTSVADKLNRQFFDIDDLIEKSVGKSITKIFEENGHDYFRQLESGVLKSAAQENNSVISCGGGIVMKDENMAVIRETGKSVFLSASLDTIRERLGDSTDRPLLNGLSADEAAKKMKEILALRLPKYRSADITLDTNNKTPEAIVDELIGKLNL